MSSELFHVLALAALFFFSWKALAAFVVLWIFGQNVGIAIGYHRLLTHRGYAVPRWLEYAIATCGTMALQGGPIYWVGVHRLHHQLTDKPGDPHSPRDGKWWSHMDWILHGTLHNQDPALQRYTPDLTQHRLLSLAGSLPLASGHRGRSHSAGRRRLAVRALGRLPAHVLGLHVTWLVNSATHMWGSRRYETRDDSRNNWWVALLTGGEGWHNNHHAHPVSARHGLAWYEFDPNYYAIWLLEKLGLARKVYVKDI